MPKQLLGLLAALGEVAHKLGRDLWVTDLRQALHHSFTRRQTVDQTVGALQPSRAFAKQESIPRLTQLRAPQIRGPPRWS